MAPEGGAPPADARPVRRFLLRRLGIAGFVLLGIATLLFLVLHLAPGDPAAVLAGPRASSEVMARLRESWGLDRPLPVQYLSWLGAVLTGDLGFSYSRGVPVTTLLGDILPNTVLLSGTALALTFAGALAVGVAQALRRGTALDRVLGGAALFFYSMPSFWLALMMILVFSLFAGTVWGWPVSFPASGMTGPDHHLLGGWGRFTDRVAHLVLPATTLALVFGAGVSRYVRAAMVEALHQDWVRAARARGLSEGSVILRHALRNALVPVVSILGLFLPILFSGTVFVEVVFAWPGMGKLMVDAIAQRDYPVVMGGGMVFAVMVVLGNLLADVLYGLVDPRIRYDDGGRLP